MRLPPRHPPPHEPAAQQRCLHLQALAAAIVGVPLSPAAGLLASARSRGRHGNALQWHLGLPAHDSEARNDWEDRIEIKLVSVWARGGGRVGSDKVKVCDVAVDPWRKLGNVLWVFADRLTRVVVATRSWHLHGDGLSRLAAAWQADPHFGEPSLFVESRESQGKRAPAYYVSARWLAETGLLPAAGPGVFELDAGFQARARAEHDRPAVIHAATAADGRQVCRRCRGPLAFDAEAVARRRWAPARHGLPHAGDCAIRVHAVVDPAWLVAPAALGPAEYLALLEERAPPWRLCEHVPEPADHGH